MKFFKILSCLMLLLITPTLADELSPVIVKDANDQVIGLYHLAGGPSVLFQGDPNVSSYFNSHTFVRILLESGLTDGTGFIFIQSANLTPRFIGTDCTGTAYAAIDGAQLDIVQVPITENASGEITLWIPVNSVFPLLKQTVTWQCQLRHFLPIGSPAFCDCNVAGTSSNVTEVEPIQTNLGNFVPEFKLSGRSRPPPERP